MAITDDTRLAERVDERERRYAASALASLQNMFDSHNEENPWLGVVSTAVLLQEQVSQLRGAFADALRMRGFVVRLENRLKAARAAIEAAITSEDGLDGGEGEDLITLIDDDLRRADAALQAGPDRSQGKSFPTIVCLCGSTRFMDAFFEAGWQETLAGKIVLSVGVAKHIKTRDGGHAAEALGPEVAEMLDELHKRKIDLADEILVLDVGGYIGDSTRSEIGYAQEHGKIIRYLEPPVPARAGASFAV